MNSKAALYRFLFLNTCIVLVCSGCSSIDCFRWWGRNTDGSNNLAGHKPPPTQPGPIAATHQNPTMGQHYPLNNQVPVGTQNVTGVDQPIGNYSHVRNPESPTVITTSPAQAAPTSSTSDANHLPANNSPAIENARDLTVPSQNTLQLGWHQPASPTNSASGVQNTHSLQPPEIPMELVSPFSSRWESNQPAHVVENIPSIIPRPMPEVAIKGPAIDINAPAPLLVAPSTAASHAVDKALAQLSGSGPDISVPQLQVPSVIVNPNVTMPGTGGTSSIKAPSLNPGSVPPPLPPPPTVPQFDKR